MTYRAIVIGISTGGMRALKMLLPSLPLGYNFPVIVVQHIGSYSDGAWIDILNNLSPLIIKEADEKEKIEKGHVYIAPPNYHLLIEQDKTFSLTIEERVNYARPSVDVLFESAAQVYKDGLIGIILTGANNDGAAGLKKIKEFGGLTIVEDPQTAEASAMPMSAIASTSPNFILPLEGIINLLIDLSTYKEPVVKI